MKYIIFSERTRTFSEGLKPDLSGQTIQTIRWKSLQQEEAKLAERESQTCLLLQIQARCTWSTAQELIIAVIICLKMKHTSDFSTENSK